MYVISDVTTRWRVCIGPTSLAIWKSWSNSGMNSEWVSVKIPDDRLLPGGVGVGVDLKDQSYLVTASGALHVTRLGKSIVKPVGEVICIRKFYLPGIPIMWRHNGGFPSIHWKRRSAHPERSRRHRGLASAAGRPTRPPAHRTPPTRSSAQRGRTERAREGPSSLISDRAYRCLPMPRH